MFGSKPSRRSGASSRRVCCYRPAVVHKRREEMRCWPAATMVREDCSMTRTGEEEEEEKRGCIAGIGLTGEWIDWER